MAVEASAKGCSPNLQDHVLVNLPFIYILSMRRGTQRKTRDYMVRGYTYVAVPILSESDLIPTLEIRYVARPLGREPYDAVIAYTSRNGRLYTPFVHDDAPAVAATYEARYAEGTRPFKRTNPAFWLGSMPTPDVRNGYEPKLDPMKFPTHYELLLEMKGEGLTPDGSDRGIREMDAQIHLSKSVLIVEGVIHTEVPEPVWDIDRQFGTFSLSKRPEISSADAQIRLDRFDAGRQRWAHRVQPLVTIFRPDLLRRDDVVQLARYGLQLWPKYRQRCAGMGGDIGREGYRFMQVEQIAAAGVPPDPQQAMTILDFYAAARRTAAQRGQRFRDKGHSLPDRAGSIATRWRFEREAYVAKHGNQGLDEADLDALKDIDLG